MKNVTWPCHDPFSTASSFLLLLLFLSLQGAQLLTAAKGLSNLKVNLTDLRV